MMSTTEIKGSALITGASSRIGAVYSDRHAERGYDLHLVARNRSELDASVIALEGGLVMPMVAARAFCRYGSGTCFN
jgi:uncharacterized protein